MVLLTMTTAIVHALEKIQNLQSSGTSLGDERHGISAEAVTTEPSLSEPLVGNPISHDQVIFISKQLKEYGLSPPHLDVLLHGSKVYIPSPPLKPEPTPEYQVLMARLRREAEARTYERMINPFDPHSSPNPTFPSTSAAHAFTSTSTYATAEKDELTYSDVSRQLTLILNVLISIVCCAAALWWVAKWWSTPARLALSMSGSIVVAVAEVVVYSGYIRRVGEAKQKEGKAKEVREVVKTWIVGDNDDEMGKEGTDGIDLDFIKQEEHALRERKKRKGNM